MSRRTTTASDSAAGSLAEAPAFRVRIGTARPGPSSKVRGFIGRIKALVRESGGGQSGGTRRAYGGCGGSAAARLPRRISPQRVVIKTRIVKHASYRGQGGAAGALQDHTQYLARRGASADGEQGIAFDAERDLTRDELTAFRERLVPDRHHFRIMVSPELGARLDLKSFARELVQEVQRDLETRLTWIGVAHYDTDQPHVHLLVRGKTSRGADLVVSRDYLSHGMRLQAGEIATRRLGPRLLDEIERSLQKDLRAERVTARDRAIDEQAALHPEGWVSALRTRDGSPSAERERLQTLSRLQHLEGLGLAREVSAGIWAPDPNLLPRLKAMSIQGDIIKTLHAHRHVVGQAMPTRIVDAEQPPSAPIVGRVTARARVDEFWDHEYLLVDSAEGQQVYVPLARHVEESGREAHIGAIVRIEGKPTVAGEEGRQPGLSITRLSSREVAQQTRIEGVTYLDRELAAGALMKSGSRSGRGFKADLAVALEARVRHLATLNLAEESQGRWRLRAGFLDDLYDRELVAAHERLALRHGALARLVPGQHRRGTVAAIEELPSGPHAVVAGQGQYILVPASPALSRAQGQRIVLAIGSPRLGLSHEPKALALSIRYQVLERQRTRGRGGMT